MNELYIEKLQDMSNEDLLNELVAQASTVDLTLIEAVKDEVILRMAA